MNNFPFYAGTTLSAVEPMFMKKRRAFLFAIPILAVSYLIFSVRLSSERQQYALNRQLIKALLRSDSKTALALVNEGADPNTHYVPPPLPTFDTLLNRLLPQTQQTFEQSPTAFMAACGTVWMSEKNEFFSSKCKEDLPLLRAMLAHGAVVTAKTFENQTALHFAVSDARLPTIELLLQHGADVNAQDDEGVTPLMRAVDNETPNTLQFLLSHGANPNLQSENGTTALHVFLYNAKDIGFIRELMAHGADPNVKAKNGETPLHYAQQHRSDAVTAIRHHNQ